MALHLYARDGETLRTRMFAPLFGIVEDPATGSANVTLGALLLSLTHAETAAYDIVQGVEMGRPSFLHVEARRLDGEIFSTVGGNCAPVFEGEVEI
jgi:trans-2,3-dihydro-3-hydroxyanthranilate isomerase